MAVRPIRVVHVTSDFRKAFERLSPRIQKLAERKDHWFRQNAFDPRLHTHQLKGPLRGYCAYSVSQQYRVLFRFLSADEVLDYDIGTHEVYRR